LKPGRSRFEHCRDRVVHGGGHPGPTDHARRCRRGPCPAALTTSRSVARPPLSQRGCRRFDSSLVDCGRSGSGRHAGTWPRRKPVRVRPVTPKHTGRWRNGKRASFARRRLRVRIPLGPPLADVAQLGEARRSDRRQCRFESDRQYHRGCAPTGRGAMGAHRPWEPGVGSSTLPVQTRHCEVVQLAPRLALNQEIRVRIVASQLTTMPCSRVGLMRRWGFLRSLIGRLGVRVSPPGHRAGRSSNGRAPCVLRRLVPRPTRPPGQLRWTGFLPLVKGGIRAARRSNRPRSSA
jgi:hypothetical protein